MFFNWSVYVRTCTLYVHVQCMCAPTLYIVHVRVCVCVCCYHVSSLIHGAFPSLSPFFGVLHLELLSPVLPWRRCGTETGGKVIL